MLELQWAASRDTEAYKKQCELERRQSFAFRNAEGKNQRLEKEERNTQNRNLSHERFELKMAGECDADDFKNQCENECRESYVFRNAEGKYHRSFVPLLE